LLTDSPKIPVDKINQTDLPIEVKNGIIHFNQERINLIETKYDQIRDSLIELQLEINKI
jgi:hypothetical protein